MSLSKRPPYIKNMIKCNHNKKQREVNIMKQNIFKILLLVGITIWVASPDVIPGPIDDIILAIVGVVQCRGLMARRGGCEQ